MRLALHRVDLDVHALGPARHHAALDIEGEPSRGGDRAPHLTDHALEVRGPERFAGGGEAARELDGVLDDAVQHVGVQALAACLELHDRVTEVGPERGGGEGEQRLEHIGRG